MLFSFRKFISSMSSNRRHNIFPPKLLKKSNTSQDKQYFLLRLSLFSSASARSPPPLVSLPPLQLFAFIICLYSVSMHFTLPRARARKHRRTGWGRAPHTVAHFRSRSAFEALQASRISSDSNHAETIYTRLLFPLPPGLTVLITTTWQATIAHYELRDF